MRSLLALMFLPLAGFGQQELPDPLQAGWKGEKVCEVLVENESVRTLRCTFPPGIGHEKHYHPKHVGYTLKGGTFRITDAKGTREVNIPETKSDKSENVQKQKVINLKIYQNR